MSFGSVRVWITEGCLLRDGVLNGAGVLLVCSRDSDPLVAIMREGGRLGVTGETVAPAVELEVSAGCEGTDGTARPPPTLRLERAGGLMLPRAALISDSTSAPTRAAMADMAATRRASFAASAPTRLGMDL